PFAGGWSGRHRRQHDARRRRRAGRTSRRRRTHYDRQGRRRDGADRHSQFRRAGRARVGISGHRQSRLAEVVGGRSAAAGVEAPRCAARATDRRTRGEARRMADSVGSLSWRAALAACLCLTFVARAHAQRPLPTVTPPSASPDFLPHANFHLAADGLQIDDPRFTWDTHFGGDVDVVDYVVGRVNGLADYEAILGNEFRLFDPNQGNYTLEFSASARVRQTEIAAV